MNTTKVYHAVVDLSAFTATDDREGERTEVDVPEPPPRRHIERTLPLFLGDIDQQPPAYSAIHVGGRRAYELARAGEEVELATRRVRIDAIELRRYDWPELELVVTCGKGVYIRSLARELGQSLGTGGISSRCVAPPWARTPSSTPCRSTASSARSISPICCRCRGSRRLRAAGGDLQQRKPS